MLAAPQHRPRPLPLFLALLRSMTDGEPARMQAALAGLKKYQGAARAEPAPLMPAIADVNGALLRDYGGSGPPVVFIPSLINPPTVLDMGDRSLLRWLATRGRRILLIDWGWPDESRRSLDVAGHVEEIALPLIGALGEPADLVGYCLGGTMALAAARPATARSVATIAAPWHFDGFPDDARAGLAKLWRDSEPAARTLGVLPMEVLQSAFWSLDPARTVAKFEAFAGMDGDEARTFVMLEDWANDGPPVAEAAAREMFEGFFAANRPGRGEWRVGGAVVDPAALPCPLLNIVSTIDRIVPAASAPRTGERLDLPLGHVGMIVGSRARELLWKPLAAWLSRHAPAC